MNERIGMIGYGAMGRKVCACLADPLRIGAVLDPQCEPGTLPDDIVLCPDVVSLVAWKPRLVVECASQVVVRDIVPTLLDQGVQVIVMSVGALADPVTRQRVMESARRGRSRAIFASGAIGGIDALRAARVGGLESVVYTGRKPPKAWLQTPAEQVVRLETLSEPAVIFKGNAAEASQLYPKNANVTATVALAGVGFEETSVTLVADPTVTCNVHEIEARGAFGKLSLRLENSPFPDNPKTSMLSALSAAQTIARVFADVEI